MLTEMFSTVYSDFDFFRPLNWHKQAVMSAMPEKDVIKLALSHIQESQHTEFSFTFSVLFLSLNRSQQVNSIFMSLLITLS